MYLLQTPTSIHVYTDTLVAKERLAVLNEFNCLKMNQVCLYLIWLKRGKIKLKMLLECAGGHVNILLLAFFVDVPGLWERGDVTKPLLRRTPTPCLSPITIHPSTESNNWPRNCRNCRKNGRAHLAKRQIFLRFME
jgi:hypothetical protein